MYDRSVELLTNEKNSTSYLHYKGTRTHARTLHTCVHTLHTLSLYISPSFPLIEHKMSSLKSIHIHYKQVLLTYISQPKKLPITKCLIGTHRMMMTYTTILV